MVYSFLVVSVVIIAKVALFILANGYERKAGRCVLNLKCIHLFLSLSESNSALGSKWQNGQKFIFVFWFFLHVTVTSNLLQSRKNLSRI